MYHIFRAIPIGCRMPVFEVLRRMCELVSAFNTPVMQEHLLSIDDTYRQYHTGPRGISTEEARQRLQQYGRNRITEKKRITPLRIFLRQFAEFMTLVLLAAAVVSGLIGDLTDTLIILVIVLLNAFVGFIQEYRAEQALAALKKMVNPGAMVLRNGTVYSIASDELVPGDLVFLEAGNRVPADIRLTETHAFRVEEASLTGESHAVEKCTAALIGDELPLGDRINMAYKGTFVAYGRARGIVVATGMNTELGKIAALLQQDELKTPLQKRLEVFSRQLSVVILVICIVVFVMGLFRGENPLLMALTAISLAVAAIPEALPAVITIALALGARRMIRMQALIRKLPAVETLGSVTYICSDKTGTLTLNQMKVQEVFDSVAVAEASLISGTDPAHRMLLQAMTLSNDVSAAADGSLLGDPTETAFCEMTAARGYSREQLMELLPRVAELPFDSDRKCMSTIHRNGNGYLVFTKGALDRVLTSSVLEPGAAARWQSAADEMAARGLRVLGFAMKELESLPERMAAAEIESGLTMLGFAGLMDPPREEVKQAVAECKTAGIRPVMITGDHVLTARTIARDLGILEHHDDQVMTGAELACLTEEELTRRVEDIRVYARVSPEQKLNIVTALQRRGQFVAMTGDGVNDAPSLKRADVGVAMGITGTDVSKEAADMILLDDNFTTIVSAVKEGRRIFDNIRKFIRYTMTSNAGEIWTIFLAPFFGLPVPLFPIHILWINLVTDGLPGLALASEKAERNVMQRPPRHPRETIFAQGLGLHILWVGLLMGLVCLFTQAWAMQTGHGHWQTMVFTVLCFSQMGHVFAVRSENDFLFRLGLFSNRPLLGAVALTFVLQLCTIYVPFLNPVFKTQPLTLNELLISLLLSLVVFHAVELEKWVQQRLRQRRAKAG